MFKKIMLLAVSAAAFAAVAAPAAQAGWTHEGAPLAQNATMNVSGFIAFGNPAPGQTKYGCVVHASITLEPGSTGKVTSFLPTTPTCVGEGALAGCKLRSHVATTPWVAHANTATGTITVTNVKYSYTYEGCAVAGTLWVLPEVTLTPDNREEIGGFNAGLLGIATSPAGAAIFTTGLSVTNVPGTFGIG